MTHYSLPGCPSAVSARQVLICICAEFLDTKLSEKSNFETSDCGKVSRLEAKTKKRTKRFGIIIIIILFIYLFDLIYLSFEVYVFVLNLVKISLFLFPY